MRVPKMVTSGFREGWMDQSPLVSRKEREALLMNSIMVLPLWRSEQEFRSKKEERSVDRAKILDGISGGGIRVWGRRSPVLTPK